MCSHPSSWRVPEERSRELNAARDGDAAVFLLEPYSADRRLDSGKLSSVDGSLANSHRGSAAWATNHNQSPSHDHVALNGVATRAAKAH